MHFKALLLASLAGMALTVPTATIDRRTTSCETCADVCTEEFNNCVIAANEVSTLISEW